MIFHLSSIYLITFILTLSAFHSQVNVNAKPVTEVYTEDLMNTYRYDVKTKILTKITSTESCGRNMRFFATPDNATTGECDCDYFDCVRPLMYSRKTNQCHYAWSQGPCKEKEWFTFDAKLSPMCETRPCKPSKDESTAPFYYKAKGNTTCYEVGTRGGCKGKDTFLATSLTKPIPHCAETLVCGGFPYPEPQLCIPGHKRALAGLCNSHNYGS